MSAHLSANLNTSVWSKNISMYLTTVVSTDIQIWYDCNDFHSRIQQHNANRLTCHITMKVVSEDSSCSIVATLLGGVQVQLVMRCLQCQWETRKPSVAQRSKWTLQVHMDPGIYGRVVGMHTLAVSKYIIPSGLLPSLLTTEANP
jgi:hypothetical protein